MPRSIPNSIQSAIQDDNCRIVHLLSFTVGETNYYFSEDQLSFLGNQYQAGLRLPSRIHYSSRLETDPVQVAIENVSLEMSSALSGLASSIQGQEAALLRLFPQAMESLALFRGRISEVNVNESQAVLTLITEFDPAATNLPLRKYSALCSWSFADSNCGYSEEEGPLDPQTATPFTSCPKDFFSCGARGRQHRFPGFLHLTREVSENNS